MNKNIIISKYYKNTLNAGPKAKVDIECFVSKYFKFEKKYFFEPENMGKIKYKILTIRQILFFMLHKFNIVLFQLPFSKNAIKKCKANCKIGIIHDINGLRYQNKEILKNEIESINELQYVIVHNEEMEKYLKGLNIKPQIFVLELFDYICEFKKDNSNNNESKIVDISYAGNLSKEKCPFIYQVDSSKINCVFNLYGKGIEKDIDNKKIYKGAFSPDILPQKISSKLGLIWDGDFDEKDENVGFKNYTKYNNPHKLSCYLASETPVVVWRKSAIANLVRKYNIGYLIKDIYELNNINYEDYEEKKKNAKELGKKVREGYFIKRVMNEILKKVDI